MLSWLLQLYFEILLLPFVWKCSLSLHPGWLGTGEFFYAIPSQTCEPRVCVDWSGAPSISARRIQALRQRTWQLEALKEGPCDWGMAGASVVGLTEDNRGDLAEEFAGRTGLLSSVAHSRHWWWWCPGFNSQLPSCWHLSRHSLDSEMWVVVSESARLSTKVLRVHG